MDQVANSVHTNYVEQKRYSEKRSPAIFIAPKLNKYIKAKYFVEYVAACCMLVAISPLMLVVALLIKLDSKGDVFFKQKRYGLSGMPIYIYKFRTMVEGAHEMQDQLKHLNEMEGGKLFKSDHDPRVTKLGKFLRKTSIDELPQLFNILKGEMAIIGPRPLSTPLYEYEDDQLVRFKVKPGLGCIWQAYFRKETDFKNWMRTDAMYVENISAKLDTKLLLHIIKNVILAKGAR